MSRKVLSFVGLFLAVVLFAGCAAIAQKTRQKTGVGGGIITGGVERLVIQGPTRVSVGGTVTLEAVGYDAKQARIERPGAVKPTWSVDDSKLGKLNTSEGKSVKFTGLAPGVCYINAVQGKATADAMVEVR